MRFYEGNRGRSARWAAALALLATVAAQAQDDADEQAGEEPTVAVPCLDHATIRRTQIIDSRNIAFITRKGEIYTNQLERECPALRPGRLVNYGISSRRVCQGTQFQVLWEATSKTFFPAAICTLGTFVPTTQAQLDDLTELTTKQRRPNRRRRAPEPDTTETIELPP